MNMGDITRREFLVLTAGTLATVGLAGCAQASSGSSGTAATGTAAATTAGKPRWGVIIDNPTTSDKIEFVQFDSMTTMLSALQAGQIDVARAPECVANYIVQRNPKLSISGGGSTGKKGTVKLSMGVPAGSTALLSKLNDAIDGLQLDGTLLALQKTYIDDLSATSEPQPAKLPVVDGAETVRVVVTGDMPPFDYVSAAGEPAGFNVAVLSAVSQRAGVTFQLVTASAGSRTAMISSGRADAVFWMQDFMLSDAQGAKILENNEATEKIVSTVPFHEDTYLSIVLK